MSTLGTRTVGPSVSIGIVLFLMVSAAPVGASTLDRAVPSAPHLSLVEARCGSGLPCREAGQPAGGGAVHDLEVTSLQVQVLAGLPFNVSTVPPVGVNLTSVSWQFGDGTNLTGQSSLSTNHTYLSPGLDYVYASALDSVGTTHDDLDALLPVNVLGSHAGDGFGLEPDLLGEIVANGSGGPNPTPFVAPGGSVTVSVVALAPPRNVQTVVAASGFSGPAPYNAAASLSAVSLDPNGTSLATVSFTGAEPGGLKTLTYWEETSLSYNGSTIVSWSNYTFGIPVSMGGAPAPLPSSPSPKTLTYDQSSAPFSFDPAIDYDTAGQEALANIYQTLIAVNGSQTGPDPNDFVPEIATCVPGSALCTSLYGSNLSNGPNLTFVLSSASQFYDPATGANWGVYPTDVVFSIARTLAFSVLPCDGCNNGWILAQALLSNGNGGWDGGLHGAFNNTPGNVFASMTVNGTACPASAISNEHGCVTFQADANGKVWPSFLELIANPWGGSIVPCGWFSAAGQGAGIPYWSQGNVSGSGDAPCAMPGVSGFGVAVGSMPETGWDAWETAGSSPPGVGNVQYAAVGSGPYDATSISAASSYTLEANPSYAPNPDCTFAGCQPAAGSYIPTVNVVVASTFDAGAAVIANGSADFADFPQNGTSSLPSLLGAGLAGMRASPILATDFHAMNLNYNTATATGLTGITYTAPSDFLADSNLRQFLVSAFPYATLQSSVFTASGIQYRYPYGGAIPSFINGLTPTNISWPFGDPDPNPSDVGSAGYWWSLTSLDSFAGASCTAIAPCTFPVPYVGGDSVELPVLNAWNASVRAISGGAIAPMITPVSFLTLIIDVLYLGAGQNPFPMYPLGWIDDYGDPSDFVTPLYLPDTTYTFGDSVAETLALSAYNSSSCSTGLTYYSSLATPLPVDCQGSAYAAMVQGLQEAANTTNGPARALLYDEAEQVAERLGLYAANGQINQVTGFAAWIDPQSVVINPAQNTIPWYSVRDLPGPSAALAVRGPIANLNPLPFGQTVELSGLATGGTSGYSYSWSGLPNGCSSAPTATLNCTPGSPGSFTVTLHAFDQTGATATGTLAVVVGSPAPLSLSGFTTAPSSVQVGSPTVLTASTAGGFAPLSYTYSGLPPGCVSKDLASYSCTPSATGSYTLHVVVNDSQGGSVQGNASLTVTAGPVFEASLAVAPATAVVDVGVPVTLTVQGAAGTLPISGSLAGPGDCARSFSWTTSRSSTISCTAPLIAGSYALNVTLTDALGRTAEVNGTLTVNAAPSIVSFGPRVSYDVNESASLTLAYTGGTGPYTISYTGLPTGCTGGNVTVVACTFTTAGPYSVGATVTDRFGLFKTSVTHLVVAPALVVASFEAVPSSIALGFELNFSTSAHGGSSPDTFAYSGLPTGCSSANLSLLPCHPTAVGTYAVEVQVRDVTGISRYANVSVTVTTGAAVLPPPTGPTGSSLLLDAVLVGVAVVAIALVVAYAVIRRRRGGTDDPESPGTAAPTPKAPAGEPEPGDGAPETAE